MMMRPALLIVVTAFVGSAFGQLGGYLPPVQEPCIPEQQTRIQTQVVTSQVVQPIQIDTTRTAYAQAIATATMAVTTFMAQTETRQINMPVIRTYEATSTSFTTVVSTNVVQAPPVSQFITRTSVVASTQVNQRLQTQFVSSFRQVQRFVTQTQQAFSVRTSVQTVQSTSVYNPPAVFSTIFRTQQAFSTQVSRLPDFFSTVTSVQIQTSQAVQFITPQPLIRTSVQQQTRVSTQVQQVFSTQQAFATSVNTRTQFVQQTSTSFVTQTSRVVSQRLQTVIRTIERVITSTQVVPQYITQTRTVQSVNQQFVTVTQTQFVTDTQTIPGPDQHVTQVITMRQDQVQIVTRTIDNVQQSTIESIYTAPCRQQVIQQTGYDYPRPANPLIF